MRSEERLFLVGRTWHTWVYVEGRRVKRTTRCRSKSAARLVARALEEAASNPSLAAAQAATVEDALFAVLQKRREQAKAGERSADTVGFYEKKSGALVRILGRDTPLVNLTAAELDGYVTTRRLERCATPTIYKELTVLRAALKLAKRHGLWSGDVDALIPALSGQSAPRVRYLRPEEVARLLQEIDGQDHAARTAFCLATGAETRATVRAQRIDVGQQAVRLRGTKRTARDRIVPVVTQWQRDGLRFVLAHAQGKGGALFAGDADKWRWALKYAARRAGIAHCTPNDLRRTFSTWMRAGGALNETLAPIMGHADGRMLDRVYARLPPALLRERLAAELGLDTVGTDATGSDVTTATNETAAPSETVPRGGIEPPTRGFSVPSRIWHAPREKPALSASARSRLDRVWTARTGRSRA
jgi:integrase